MTHEWSLADLLKIILCLEEELPVFATPSFAGWLRSRDKPAWPPAMDPPHGLALIDTRDRVSPQSALAFIGSGLDGVSAALILSGSGVEGSLPRRLLRWARQPGTRRAKEARVSRTLSEAVGAQFVQRLAFADRGGVPTGFQMGGPPDSSGAAFLVTRTPLFAGPLWSIVAERLQQPSVQVDGFHLRARGAAVVLLRSEDGGCVVRIVPDGPLQEVILKNHSALTELRLILEGQDTLLRRMPAPLFVEQKGSHAILGETRLSGVLAWKVASGRKATVIYGHARAYLDQLRAATARPIPNGGAAALLQEDLARLERATFVSAMCRHLIGAELSAAADVLRERDICGYTSHGDFGYGNILVHPASGRLEGVIDWDTARFLDLPGIDRVNMEIQILRGAGLSFAHAVDLVWLRRSAHDALEGESDTVLARALFGAAVCRYVTRSFSYPALYLAMQAEFDRALSWMAATR